MGLAQCLAGVAGGTGGNNSSRLTFFTPSAEIVGKLVGNVHRRCAVDGGNWIMAASRPQPLIAGRLSLVETLLELFLKYFHCPISVRHGATSRCSINRLTLPNRTLRAVEKWATEVGLADKSVKGRLRLWVRLLIFFCYSLRKLTVF